MRSNTKAKSRQDASARPLKKGPSFALRPTDLGDDALLELVQRQTLRHFWDFAHLQSGLAREHGSLERPLLALEPEQRLEHERRDSRLDFESPHPQP